jgi:phasin family protein
MADETVKGAKLNTAVPVAKIDAAAEKAYAEAAAKIADKPAPKAAAPVTAAPAKVEAPKPAKAVASAKKPAAKKPVAKPVAAKKPAAKKPAAKAAKAISPPATPITKLKETIMATAQKTDFTATAKEMAAELQTRVQGAYAKTTELTSEVTEFSKGNVDAVVESGKIFFTGAQELVRDNLETGKVVVETVTADAKKMMEVKSPTELMQMQGDLARRNFDAIVSYGSKRTEAWVKLYNEAFAPITNRVSVAAEKVSKAA